MNKQIVKISIYNSSCSPLEIAQGNGDAILDSICTYCVSDENLFTGEYYLDAEFSVDKNGLWKYIQEESILKVYMDYGEEYYRISKINSNEKYITVFARQETIYQTLHMWLEDVRPENRNGFSALNHIKDNSIGPKNINMISDIQNTSTAYYQLMNVYEAIHTCDQSFLNRWGGEIQRRKYDLIINKKIGQHRGVQIRSNKNLTGFEANVDMDNVFTRIKPWGFDGITIDNYVDSPLINNYKYIKTTKIEYSNVKVKDPTKEDDEGFDTLEEAKKELIRLAELEYSQNNIDKIKAEYTINFIHLEQTEEYKNYIQAERIYLGDEIDVYEESLDIDITVRAINKKYDILKQRTLEIVLSNETIIKTPPTIGDILDNLNKIEDDIKDNNNWYKDAIDNATSLIQNGLKDSYVVVRQNEILIMDTTDINTATNVWRWNKGGLGFSSTGYFGKFETAITMDGSIVGKFITGLIIKGNQIDAKQLTVYNDNGIKTLEVTSNGEVNLNVNSLKIKSSNVITESEVNNKISSSESSIRIDMEGIAARVSKTETATNQLDIDVQSAQSLAEYKSKVFISTPKPPYNVGDLWVQGSSGDVMRCKFARSSGSYVESDWEKASKYTDDSKANKVEGDLNSLNGTVTTISEKYASLKQDVDGFKTTVSSTYTTKVDFESLDKTVTNTIKRVESNESSISQLSDDITLKVEHSDIVEALGPIEGQVTDHEERIKTAELKITKDAIVSTVTSSEEWEEASGGINLIPNPTASQNLDGWLDTGNCSIKRYINNQDIYIPSNPSTPPSTNLDDKYYPQLHLIQAYGEGLCMLLKDCSGKVILFDGGYLGNKDHVISYLTSLGITKLNYYIITHFHSDHAECAADVLNHFGADYAIFKEAVRGTLPAIEEEWRTYDIYDNFKNMCITKGVKILNPQIDFYIKLSEYSSLKIFNSNSKNYSDYNHQSLMFLYQYKDNKMFLAGDGTNDSDLGCLGQIGKVDFIQLGHHGDGTAGGTSRRLIDELKPKYAYFASTYLATGWDSLLYTETLKRVSWHYAVSFTHGTGHNGDFYFELYGDSMATNGIQTFSKNVWYERESGMWFWFKGDGYLAQSEWLAIDGYWYYFGDDYLMYRNKWKQTESGNWYYLKDNGHMAANETININGKDYIFDSNGVCTNP